MYKSVCARRAARNAKQNAARNPTHSTHSTAHLVDAQHAAAQLKKPHVGRHGVADGELDDVAGHELGRRHDEQRAAAQRLGGAGLVALELLDRALGVALGRDADDRCACARVVVSFQCCCYWWWRF
jgi:hypothetical protein